MSELIWDEKVSVGWVKTFGGSICENDRLAVVDVGAVPEAVVVTDAGNIKVVLVADASVHVA